MKKIALVGSAPSSVNLAPFGDTSWEIWGCSPGLYPFAKRVNAWFEIHNWELGKERFSTDYKTFMAKLACPVYMISPVAEIPGSVAYPIDAVFNHVCGWTVNPAGEWRARHFSRADFSSSISWMFALAIMQKPDVIGLWGIDMSASEEWVFQRSACQNMIELCKALGIEVAVPGESDILRPPPLYGFCEVDPLFIKTQARNKELQARVNAAAAAGQNAQREADYLRGAMDNQQYFSKTWLGNPFHLSQNTHERVNPYEVPVMAGSTGEPSVDATVDAIAEAAVDWRELEETLDADKSAGKVEVPTETLAQLSTAIAASEEAQVRNGSLQI